MQCSIIWKRVTFFFALVGVPSVRAATENYMINQATPLHLDAHVDLAPELDTLKAKALHGVAIATLWSGDVLPVWGATQPRGRA